MTLKSGLEVTFWSLKMVLLESLDMLLYSHYSNYVHILYYLRNKRNIGRKSRFFHTPVFDAPLGGPSRNIAMTFGTEKLE